MTEKSPKRRRWLQFRLRTLLIAVLVLSVPLSWFAVKMEKARRQREAVEVFRKLGYTLYDWEAVEGTFAGGPEEPPWLLNLLGIDYFHKVVYVSLGDYITDADLEHLTSLPHVEDLTIRAPNASITDAGLEHLERLPNLQRLSLHLNSQITDAALLHVTNLCHLRGLWLEDTGCTQEGVERLQAALPDCSIAFY